MSSSSRTVLARKRVRAVFRDARQRVSAVFDGRRNRANDGNFIEHNRSVGNHWASPMRQK